MPGLFDNTGPYQGGGILSGMGNFFAGIGGAMNPAIRENNFRQQAYNSLSQQSNPGDAALLMANPQAYGMNRQQQIMQETYRQLVSKVGPQNAALLAMNPNLMGELAKPQAVQPGAQLQAPLNLLGGGPQQDGQGQPPQMPQEGATQQQPQQAAGVGPTNTSGIPSDEQAMQIAKQWVLGDSHALDILGRGYSGLSALARQKVMQARDQIMAQQGMTMQDISANQMKYGGLQKTIGQMYQSNNALNTGIGHMSQLADVFQNLGNASFQPSNYVKNLFGTIIGKSGPTNYKAVVGRVAPEITRIWRGAGGAESDIERDLGTLSESNSPEQGYGAIANIAKLMGSKIDANKYQYESVFGHGSGKFMLNPENEAALGKLQQSGTTTPTNTPQQFKEGDTATNPKTGQKALFKGGRWQIQ